MSRQKITMNKEVLFETDIYAVHSAALPVKFFNDSEAQPVTRPGYEVVHKEHMQSNGEFRSFAEACIAAFQWTEQIKGVQQAASGVVVPKPKLQGLN